MKTGYLIVLLVGLISCISDYDSIQAPPVGLGSEEPFLTATDFGLILSWMEPINGDIHLRYAVFNGSQWSEPKTIARGTNWFVNWADFPALINNGDKLFAHYLEISGEHTYDYNIMYTVSDDRGINWSVPQKLHSDTIKGEHGFVSGIPFEEGFAVAWLDGRYTTGEKPRMTLRGAIINGEGQVTADYELDSMTCDCCQTTMVEGVAGPNVFYRDRTIDEIRDISQISFTSEGPGAITSLHDDQWHINACPVNGPAAAGYGETLAVAWYAGKDENYEVKLKISEDGGASFGDPIQVDGPASLGRVDIQMTDSRIYLTYLTRKDDAGSIVLAIYSLKGKLISKIPLATANLDRDSGFPRTAIWQNTLILTWTSVEDASVRVLSYPLADNPHSINTSQAMP